MSIALEQKVIDLEARIVAIEKRLAPQPATSTPTAQKPLTLPKR